MTRTCPAPRQLGQGAALHPFPEPRGTGRPDRLLLFGRGSHGCRGELGQGVRVKTQRFAMMSWAAEESVGARGMLHEDLGGLPGAGGWTLVAVVAFSVASMSAASSGGSAHSRSPSSPATTWSSMMGSIWRRTGPSLRMAVCGRARRVKPRPGRRSSEANDELPADAAPLSGRPASRTGDTGCGFDRFSRCRQVDTGGGAVAARGNRGSCSRRASGASGGLLLCTS